MRNFLFVLPVFQFLLFTGCDQPFLPSSPPGEYERRIVEGTFKVQPDSSGQHLDLFVRARDPYRMHYRLLIEAPTPYTHDWGEARVYAFERALVAAYLPEGPVLLFKIEEEPFEDPRLKDFEQVFEGVGLIARKVNSEEEWTNFEGPVGCACCRDDGSRCSDGKSAAERDCASGGVGATASSYGYGQHFSRAACKQGWHPCCNVNLSTAE